MNKIILILIAIIASSITTNEAHASCIAEVNYTLVTLESELVFIGTVTDVQKPGGPQLITFDVHEVIKGNIPDTYVLADKGVITSEDGYGVASSISMNYKIGETYSVFVTNGETSICTTKPVDEMQGMAITKESYNIYPIIVMLIAAVLVSIFVLKKRK